MDRINEMIEKEAQRENLTTLVLLQKIKRRAYREKIRRFKKYADEERRLRTNKESTEHMIDIHKRIIEDIKTLKSTKIRDILKNVQVILECQKTINFWEQEILRNRV